MAKTYAETFLMREAAACNDHSLFADAWKTAFLPEGEIAILRHQGEARETLGFLVLANHGAGCLGFPMKRHSEEFVVLDYESPDARVLRYHIVRDFASVYILPTAPVSPLHCLVMRRNKPSLRPGVQLKITGKPVPLLAHQALRGFGGVPEVSLKALAHHLNAPECDTTSDGILVEDALAASLILVVRPKVTRAELCEAMHARKLIECGAEPANDDELSQSVMDDVLNPSDRQHIVSGKQKLVEERKKRADRHDRVQKVVAMFIAKLPKPRSQKDKYATKVDKIAREKAARWWSALVACPAAVQQWKPDSCFVIFDQNNGRFLFRHALIKGQRRSISWTVRGMESAVVESLRIMWAWEREVNGTECPLPHDWIGHVSA